MYPFDKALLGYRRDGKPDSEIWKANKISVVIVDIYFPALETIFPRRQTVSAMIRDYSLLLLKELA